MFNKVFERKTKSLGAFEVSSNMLRLAKNNDRHDTFLNAGRGNPNWINTEGRLAFARLTEFGVEESRRMIERGTLAGSTTQRGIVDRLYDFLDDSSETDAFIKKSVEYVAEELGLDREAFVAEMVNAILGNNYPVPSRCLENTEVILNEFLQSTLYGDTKLADKTKIFPTEGGTAAICYLFDCLKHNGLLSEGDHIAINTPIFTPYIQIPRLTNFQFTEINLYATEESNWHVPDEEFDKLLDPGVKAFFLVNPNNPGSHALSDESMARIEEIIKKRPDLIIITDDVYGTFVDDFKTVYSIAPHNTLLVYSFSKLYGVTGWRIGLVAAHEDNIFDRMIGELPEDKLKELDNDYSIVSTEPRKMSFIDRLCADSRSIGLYHTSGLSTPQQAFMALLSLTHLTAGLDDKYIDNCRALVAERYHTLFGCLDIPEDNGPTNTKYYALINIYKIAAKHYDVAFANYLKNSCDQMEFLTNLARNEGVVLMEGAGFSAPDGTLRVSLANLPTDAYKRIAKRLLNLLEEYHEKYMTSAK